MISQSGSSLNKELGGTEEDAGNKKSKNQKISLGNEVLDQLWNQTLTIEDFEGPPTIQTVLAPAIAELQSGETDPELPRLVEGKIFQWKAYRMIMSHSFDLMLSLNNRSLEDVLADNPFKTESRSEIGPTEPDKSTDSPTSNNASPVVSAPASPPHKRDTSRPEKEKITAKKQKNETSAQEISKKSEKEADTKREKEADVKRQRLTRSDRSNK